MKNYTTITLCSLLLLAACSPENDQAAEQHLLKSQKDALKKAENIEQTLSSRKKQLEDEEEVNY